jgi:tetratricopeptide (TPR) repeat protein/Fe2+ transport system protein FeoA
MPTSGLAAGERISRRQRSDSVGDGVSDSVGDGVSTSRALVIRDEIPPPEPVEAGAPPRRRPAVWPAMRQLMDLGCLPLARFEVRVAAPAGSEPAARETRRLIRALRRLPGIRVRRWRRKISLHGLWNDADVLAAAQAAGRRWLAELGGDLLIWGEVPPPGTSIHLRFVSAVPPPPDRAGAMEVAALLALPVDFGRELVPILHAAVLAAIEPRSLGKARRRERQLGRALAAAETAIAGLSPALAPVERGTLHACFANAAAAEAQRLHSPPLRMAAVRSYLEAAHLLQGDEWSLTRAFGAKNLGLALMIDAGGGNVAERWDAAVRSFREALRSLDPERFPVPWAIAQTRLGEALFRLEAYSADPQLLKQAIAAHLAALQVFNRRFAPVVWAEVMHNLAQAAQVLGEELRSAEVLAKAAEACRAALRVRTREAMPQLWAMTQNDLGTALFLLGRQTAEADWLAAAAEAFEQARSFYAGQGMAAAAALVARNLARLAELQGNPKPAGRTAGGDVRIAGAPAAAGQPVAVAAGAVVPFSAGPTAGPPRKPGSRNSRRRRSDR